MDVGGDVDVRGHVFIFVILFFTALHEEASSSLLSLFFMFISLLPKKRTKCGRVQESKMIG